MKWNITLLLCFLVGAGFGLWIKSKPKHIQEENTNRKNQPVPVKLGWDMFAAVKTDPASLADLKLPEALVLHKRQRVILVGYMNGVLLDPENPKNGFLEFFLTKDQGTCCFGQEKKLEHLIYVRSRKPIPLTNNLIEVEGILGLEKEMNEFGDVLSIYQIDALNWRDGF